MYNLNVNSNVNESFKVCNVTFIKGSVRIAAVLLPSEEPIVISFYSQFAADVEAHVGLGSEGQNLLYKWFNENPKPVRIISQEAADAVRIADAEAKKEAEERALRADWVAKLSRRVTEDEGQ